LTFAEAAASARQEGNLHILPMALSHLARLQGVQGRLHQAEETYRQALEAAGTTTGRASPLAGIAYTGLGSLLYEWNDLAAAQAHLSRGIALARPWLAWDTLVPGYLTLAALKWAQGDAEAAAEVAAESLKVLDATEGMFVPPPAVSQLAASQALLQVRWGNVAAAARWAEGCNIDPEGEIPHAREAEALILARVWIAEGRPADAEQLLARLRAAAEAGGRTGRLIEVLVLQAVASHTQGQSATALNVLCQALLLAEPEGWVRTFVDEGASVAELLGQVDRQCAPGYVARLRAAFGPPSSPPTSTLSAHPLIEPLSERELEVLCLIAAGLSNQEIADRLIISLNTVKTHVKNLYGKLGTGNRTQTIARARELGLLSN
jgi:LuxR family maltose regulon positive regulatory protein